MILVFTELSRTAFYGRINLRQKKIIILILHKYVECTPQNRLQIEETKTFGSTAEGAVDASELDHSREKLRKLNFECQRKR